MKWRARLHRSSSGFTLLEVLVAMAIFSIASSAVSRLMVTSTSIVSLNKDYAEAVAVAQKTIEKLRAIDYELMENGSQPEDANGYSASWAVTEDDPEPGTKTIIVTVSWTHKSEQKEYVTQTIFSQVTA